MTFSEKKYYDVSYNDKSGFTVGELCKPELITGTKALIIADLIQAGNFIINSFQSAKSNTGENDFYKLYAHTVSALFNPDNIIYLTTGEPHSRAYYLRNPGFFYRDMLNSETALNREDYIKRMRIVISGTEFMLKLFYGENMSTTAVPAGGRYFAAVNYFNEPSDSLQGILTSLESLVFPARSSSAKDLNPIMEAGVIEGKRMISIYKNDLKDKITTMLKKLEKVKYHESLFIIPDRDKAMSAATDTRDESARFIVSANYYTMLTKGIKLGVISDEDIKIITGMNHKEYKSSILKLFGNEGYIKNSLNENSIKPGDSAREIVLDFVHVKGGFWDLNNKDEFRLFKNTSDIILNDRRFFDEFNKGIMMSIDNPPVRIFHKATAPEYQGRVVWPFYNAEFADNLLLLYRKTGNLFYLERAGVILNYLKDKTIQAGGYPEVLDPEGGLYRTYIYKSALANSWIPGFYAVLNDYEQILKRSSFNMPAYKKR